MTMCPEAKFANGRAPAGKAAPRSKEAVPADVLSALYACFRSRREHTIAEKVLSAMRQGFGGHVEPKAGHP